MKISSSFRLLLGFFTLTIICLVMAVAYRLLDGVMPSWAVCCNGLERLLPVDTTQWLPFLPRTIYLGILTVGASILWRRLWKTHNFISQLNLAATDLCSARLDALLTECGLASSDIVPLATPVPLAFCYGFFRPRICLSIGLLDTLSDKELKAVLLHEVYHCRRYDPLRTLVVDVLADVFFFLPIVAEWRDMLITSIELAADRYAIQYAGRASLAGAIYKLLTHPKAIRLSPAMSGVSGFSASQSRLSQLLNDPPAARHFSSQSLMISSLVLTLGCILLQLSLS